MLGTALALRPAHLSVLAATSGGSVLGRRRSDLDVLSDGPDPVVTALGRSARLVEQGDVAAALRLLESAPLAGLPDLLRLLREEVLDWTWKRSLSGLREQSEPASRATAVLGDALVAGWHTAGLSAALGDQLRRPYATALTLLDPVPVADLGPQHVTLAGLFDALRRLEEPAELVRASDRSRARSSWAASMHSATWAVSLSGRVRPAAAAQLASVHALSAAGLTVRDAAAGAWNVVSGATQALVVEDLLDEDTRRRLVAPVTDVLERDV